MQEPRDVRQSVDFYFTLALELTALVQKAFKQKKCFFAPMLPRLVEIFEVFVVFECPSPSATSIFKSTLGMVKQAIKSFMTEKQCLNFVVQVINDFLSKPVALAATPPRQLYSQK